MSHIAVAIALCVNSIFFTQSTTSIIIQITTALLVLLHNLDDRKLKHNVLSILSELNEQNNYTQTVIESNETAIIAIDNSAKVMTFNKKAQEIFQYSKEEMIGGNNLSKIIPDDYLELHNNASENFFKTGISKGILHSTQELYGKKKDGTVFPIKISFGISASENKVLVIANIIDNTKEYEHRLEQQKLLDEIESTQKEVIYKIGSIVEGKSLETSEHVDRVAKGSELLALLSGMNEKEAAQLKLASPMHDVGKISIPDNILNKPSKLSDEEFEIMKTHAKHGYEVLKGSQRPLLKTASIVAHEHHERWDGKGYPQGLKEDNIHIYGRITAIIDVYDALSHKRVYKDVWSDDEILEYFKEQQGKQFDPTLVDLFLNNFDQFKAINT